MVTYVERGRDLEVSHIPHPKGAGSQRPPKLLALLSAPIRNETVTDDQARRQRKQAVYTYYLAESVS